MIKIYDIKSCPGCVAVNKRMEGNSRCQVIGIGEHVSLSRGFLRLRDNSPVFDEAKKKGYVGIPCLVLEDGTAVLNPKEAGLKSGRPKPTSCRIGDSDC